MPYRARIVVTLLALLTRARVRLVVFGACVAALASLGGCMKGGHGDETHAPTAVRHGGSSARYASGSPPPASPDHAAPAEEMAMGTAADASARRDRSAYHQPAPTTTPGLGTAYGERTQSSVVSTAFERESGSPDALLSLWYNDWDGIQAMAAAYGNRPASTSTAASADGAFTVQILDEYDRPLPATDIDGRRYAAGYAGARYKIRVSNNSPFRFEVVTSVDGLDVIDGSEAAFHKRGYVLDAWASITIDGWRTSDDTVAAFRFSEIEDSYAERTGNGRNVGVVGVAFFHERGAAPWEALGRRHSSDPFPGRYAPPPPPRWR